MRHLALLAAVTSACLWPQIAAAQDDNSDALQPTTEWKLREYSDNCRITRVFGEGKDSATMWLDQGGPEPSYNLTLIGRPFRHPYGGGIELQFGDEKPNLRSYIKTKSSTGRPVVTMFGVALAPPEIHYEEDAKRAEIGPEREAAITSLRISKSIRKPVKLATGRMDQPLALLRACAMQLDITLAKASRSTGGKSRGARPTNLKELDRLIRYPVYLARTGMEGDVEFRLTINAKGKPTNCHIFESNRPQLFDDAVCLGMMQHATFDPALDAEGQPIASYYYSMIRFYIA